MAPRWTANQDAALRIGVHRHGLGNWNVIREEFMEIIGSRSSKNLMNKWMRILRANDATAAALANAYQVLDIAPPAYGYLAALANGPPADGNLDIAPPADDHLADGPPADGPPAAPLVDGHVCDAPSLKLQVSTDVDDDVDVDDDEEYEDADEKFVANLGKSLKCKDSFQTAYFYCSSRGIWCRYKEKIQELLRHAFKEDLPYVKVNMSGNRVKLLDIYRMTEYSLWKVGPNAKSMGWMDTAGQMHYPGHVNRYDFTVVLKGGEDTFVSIPKLMTALDAIDFKKLNNKMFKLASMVLGEYGEMFKQDKLAFADLLETYGNTEFLTLLGTLV